MTLQLYSHFPLPISAGKFPRQTMASIKSTLWLTFCVPQVRSSSQIIRLISFTKTRCAVPQSMITTGMSTRP